MTNEQTILAYAASRNGIVVRKAFRAWLEANHPTASWASYDVVLRQMVGKGSLKRTGRGVMNLAASLKKAYLPRLDSEISAIYSRLAEEYPYTEICVWSVSSVSSFVQHVPFSNTIVVEAERLAAEAVFHSVKAITDRTVLLSPTQKEYDLYSSHEGNIIVKPLISEAPTIDIEGVKSATLEKILVDIAVDPGFSFASGAELNTIYENAFEMYDISTQAMLRYASRRGKKEEIEELLNDSNI